MKKIFITLALVSATLFTYAEKEETNKVDKIKTAIENLFEQKEITTELKVDVIINTNDLIDIKPFVKPEKEVEDDF